MKNNNYPTWLVSLDIAQQLKEIGFNEYCPFFVYPNDDETNDDEVFISGTVTVEEDWLDEDNYGEVIIDLSVTECGKFNKYNFQTIPTWTEVFAWFRARGLYSYIRSCIASENFYIYSIYDNNNFDKCCGRRDTYEEAQKECVKALIKTYKNKLEKNNL